MEKLVYSVENVMHILGVGKNQAYQLAQSGVFPIRRIGRRIVIPKKGFMIWLEGNEEIDKAQ